MAFPFTSLVHLKKSVILQDSFQPSPIGSLPRFSPNRNKGSCFRGTLRVPLLDDLLHCTAVMGVPPQSLRGSAALTETNKQKKNQPTPPNTSGLSKFISPSHKSPHRHAGSALRCWDPPPLMFCPMCVDQHGCLTSLPSSHQAGERGRESTLGLSQYDPDLVPTLYSHPTGQNLVALSQTLQMRPGNVVLSWVARWQGASLKVR